MIGRWLRTWVVLGVALVAASFGGVAGAQTAEQYATGTAEEAATAEAGAVPVLEERVRERSVRLEEGVERISAVGADLEESQLEVEGVRARARELEEEARGLERRLQAQRETYKAAKEEYERRARAAYKGGELRGVSLLLDGLFGSGEGGAGLTDPLLAEALFGGRESLEAYEESKSLLVTTSRQISQKNEDYEAAVREERARAEELRRREQELEDSIASISAGKERAESRLQELEAAERARVLKTRPATGGGPGTRGYEIGLARGGIVAREVAPIPKREYLKLYKEAAREYGFARDWYILAAVGEVESGHGANMGPSSAGAMGPMQFLPSTWETSGVDGNGDGVANIMDPEDAIPAAAGYLKEGGAPKDWYRALFSYNHADWYVKKVLGVAEGYRRLSEDDRVGPYS